MSACETVCESVHRDRSARRLRDPLQVPTTLSFDDERASPDIVGAARDFLLWLAIVCGAAFGVFFVAASVPELRAAAHQHAFATPPAADTTPSAQRAPDR